MLERNFKSLESSVTEKFCLVILLIESFAHLNNYVAALLLIKALAKKNIFFVGTIVQEVIVQSIAINHLKNLKKIDKNFGIINKHDGTTPKSALVTNMKSKEHFEVGRCKHWKKNRGKNLVFHNLSWSSFIIRELGEE